MLRKSCPSRACVGVFCRGNGTTNRCSTFRIEVIDLWCVVCALHLTDLSLSRGNERSGWLEKEQLFVCIGGWDKKEFGDRLTEGYENKSYHTLFFVEDTGRYGQGVGG